MLAEIEKYKIVPVAVFHELQSVGTCLDALEQGGLPLVEITFRTACAAEAIRFAVNHHPKMSVGAGTVINAEQCEKALEAGAGFIVSPGLSEEVARVCQIKNVPYIPGVATASEIMRALSLGISRVKFFPAGALGGPTMLRALGAAFPQVWFLPTGGINQDNLLEYLRYPRVFACGGSWMFDKNPDIVEQRVRIAVKSLREEQV